MDFIDIKVSIPNMVLKQLYQATVELLQTFHVEKCFVWDGTQHYMYGELKLESTNSQSESTNSQSESTNQQIVSQNQEMVRQHSNGPHGICSEQRGSFVEYQLCIHCFLKCCNNHGHNNNNNNSNNSLKQILRS